MAYHRALWMIHIRIRLILNAKPHQPELQAMCLKCFMAVIEMKVNPEP